MVEKSKINQKHLWYVVGYITSDGNLSKDGRHITIVSKDIEHLIKIQSVLSIKSKIGMFANGTSKSKSYGRLQFSDVNFYKYLQSINLFPKKSLVLKDIKVNMNYIDDFIRGLIDGDGCIRSWRHSSNNLIQWSTTIISASPIFIHWVKNLIENTYLIKGKIYKYDKFRKNPIYRIKFGKLASQVLLSKIYYPNCLCLERKYSIAVECLLDKPKMLNYNSIITPGW